MQGAGGWEKIEMRGACNDELLDETEEWDMEERRKEEGRNEREIICVRVAH